MSSCPVELADETAYQPFVFEATSQIDWIASHMPRFGKSSNLLAAMEATNNNEAKEDYLVGITAAAMAVFGFFFLWALACGLLSLAGFERVGLLSGTYKVKRPPDPEAYEKNDHLYPEQDLMLQQEQEHLDQRHLDDKEMLPRMLSSSYDDDENFEDDLNLQDDAGGDTTITTAQDSETPSSQDYNPFENPQDTPGSMNHSAVSPPTSPTRPGLPVHEMSQSRYLSPAAAKKRAIEEFVRNRKEASARSLPSPTYHSPNHNSHDLSVSSSVEFWAPHEYQDKALSTSTPAEEEKVSEEFAYSRSPGNDSNNCGNHQASSQSLLVPALDHPVEDVEENDDNCQGETRDASDPSLTHKDLEPRVHEPTYEEDLQVWFDIRDKHERSLARMRVVIFVCGSCIISVCILFTLLGVESLMTGLRTTQSGVNQIQQSSQSGIDLLDDFTLQSQQAFDASVSVMSRIDSYCPGIQPSMCSQPFDAFDCDIGDEYPFAEALRAFLDSFQSGSAILGTSFDAMKWDLQQLDQDMDYVNANLDQFKWAFWVAAGFANLTALLVLSILFGLVLTWQGKMTKSYRCFRTNVVMPMFLCSVFIGFVFSMAGIVGMIATADFCNDSGTSSTSGPDEKVLLALQSVRSDYSSSTSLFDYLSYYVAECAEDQRPVDVFGLRRDSLDSLMVPVTRLVSVLNQPDSSQETLCGVSSLTNLMEETSALGFQMCVMIQELVSSVLLAEYIYSQSS